MGRSIFPRQDTPIPEECNLDKLPDIFVHDAPKVGNDCVTVFCFAKFKDGILLNQVEAWASVNDGLQWINVSWTDGSSEEASSMPSGQSEDYHGIVDWDLWRDWFKEFLLWGDLWGLSRMIITMDHSKCGGKDDCRSDAGGKNIGDEHVFSRGTKGDGMLLGLCGRHGTLAIDQLQPLFTSSRPTVLKIKDAKTTPTVDDLNSKSNLG
jgi:hypothetical protein